VTFEDRETPPVPRVHKLELRLAPETVAALIEDYLGGMPSRACGQKFGLAKNSVLGVLKQHGVSRPRIEISDEALDQAVNLLARGVALKPIAEGMGLAPSTLQRALQSRGLPTRKTWV
jgi:hypothetical protein